LADTPRDEPIALSSFVEKPDLQTAQSMLKHGKYLWNAGIFLFRVQDIIHAFELYAPDLLQTVRHAVEQSVTDLGFWRLDPTLWSACTDISIDYAVMEKTDNLVAVPFSAEWSDLGGWDSLWQAQKPDSKGVVTSEQATAVDCRDVLLRSEHPSVEIVGLGLENIVAVATQDAVLVACKDRSQEVKKVVGLLKQKAVAQAETFPKDHRPWGWYEILASSERFQVKRIVVKPGAALSLQSHHHRSEHWVVVEGTAKVTVDDTVSLITEGQSVYIPLGAVHRLENPGKVEMALIEVQTGVYLGEDDIVRYEDLYDRK
jgi:mannose-1-phosphate guanylyltransferase/mannose-1-phosphate guanylyltransferase/mannose-6-phosphate isomerase